MELYLLQQALSHLVVVDVLTVHSPGIIIPRWMDYKALISLLLNH